MSAEPVAGPPRESALCVVGVTLAVCAVCSAAIAGAVTWLRPYQEANRERERAARVLEVVAAVPGLEELLGPPGAGEIEAHVVALDSGRFDDSLDPETFDARAAAEQETTSVALPAERDLAGIGRRARHATVYLVRQQGRLRLVVLPVHGAGYLSTLRGYLALDADAETVRGLSFYEHAETPGLGSLIDEPAWRAQWAGKRLYDERGELRVGVARGRVDPASPEARHLVDGISGATRTAAGVGNLVRFWLGPDGFGPFLERLARGEIR